MKIAYFDYWTRGIGNFVHLDARLHKRGHDTILLHIGAYYGDQEKEEIVSGIKCRNLTFYSTKMIYKMLEREKPDTVITLNSTKMLDRVVVMSCRALKIPCFYLTHGTRDLGSSNDLLITLMEKAYNSFSLKIGSAGRYLTFVIPNYLYALAKYKPSNIGNFRFLKVLYSYYKNPGKRLYSPEYVDELLHDKCMVFSLSEARYYKKLGYNYENIVVVGNPKMDAMLDILNNNRFTTDMLPERVRTLVQSGKKYALYLEESFPETGNMGGFTSQVRNQFIEDCSKRLERESLALVVKLHPTTEGKAINAGHGNCFIDRTS